MMWTRMRGVVGVVAVVLGTGLLGGCVGQGEMDRVVETNRSLTARNADLERENAEQKLAIDQLRGSGVRGESTMSELQRRNAALRKQLDDALANLKDLESRVSGMAFGPVNAETDRALQALASQYPDLIKYDSSRGMLRFASDLTFDSGSAMVKDNAKQALDALGQILNSSAAAEYEVVVEGHTDSQRIANPATLKLHPTNRHLSAHRAIGVIEQLGNRGVAPSRMLACGWGEHRPAVPNSPNGNTPANRRVEIYLTKLPSTSPVGTEEAGPTSVAPDRAAPPERQIDVTK